MDSLPLAAFTGLAAYEPVAFLGGEPVCLGWIILQVPKRGDGQNQCRQGLGYEHELPAAKAQKAVDPKDEGGERGADDGGHRCGGHEDADHVAAVLGGEIQCEEEHDPWEEACFSRAEQEADDVETGFAVDEGHGT